MAAAKQLISEIIATQSTAAAVFHRFEISASTCGDESLEGVCAELQLSVDQVLEKLEEAEEKQRGLRFADFSNYSLGRLIQHIVRNHHQFIRQELPRLAEMNRKLARNHTQNGARFLRLEPLLDALQVEITAHLKKEEEVLFPYIAQMEGRAFDFRGADQTRLASIMRPVSAMVREHESAERRTTEIRDLTNNFTAPAEACVAEIALYAGLLGFAIDIQRHVQIENLILFPRALEMDSILQQRR